MITIFASLVSGVTCFGTSFSLCFNVYEIVTGRDGFLTFGMITIFASLVSSITCFGTSCFLSIYFNNSVSESFTVLVAANSAGCFFCASSSTAGAFCQNCAAPIAVVVFVITIEAIGVLCAANVTEVVLVVVFTFGGYIFTNVALVILVIINTLGDGRTAKIAFVIARIFVYTYGNGFAAKVTFVIFVCIYTFGEIFFAANITLVVVVLVEASANRNAANVTAVIVVVVFAGGENLAAPITLVIVFFIVYTLGDLVAANITDVIEVVILAIGVHKTASIALVVARIFILVTESGTFIGFCVSVATSTGVGGVTVSGAGGSGYFCGIAVVTAKSNVICCGGAFLYQFVEMNSFLTGIRTTLVVTEAVISIACVRIETEICR